jgi:hypothetical protein
MSWSLQAVTEEAESVTVELDFASGNERESRVLDVVKESVQAIVDAVGGYVAVSGSGHLSAAEGEPGDTITISIATLPRPDGPTFHPDPSGSLELDTGAADAAPAGDGSSLNPGGTVAPAPGSDAPMSAGGTPGLETAPETQAQPTDIGEKQDAAEASETNDAVVPTEDLNLGETSEEAPVEPVDVPVEEPAAEVPAETPPAEPVAPSDPAVEPASVVPAPEAQDPAPIVDETGAPVSADPAADAAAAAEEVDPTATEPSGFASEPVAPAISTDESASSEGNPPV